MSVEPPEPPKGPESAVPPEEPAEAPESMGPPQPAEAPEPPETPETPEPVESAEAPEPVSSPPAAPAPPAAPPPDAAGPRPGAEVASVHPMDWGIMATGLLTLIFSFFDYYDYSLGPFSANYNAWDGFFGWFSTLAAVLSAVLLAVSIFLPGTSFPVPLRLTVLTGFALSALCVVFAGFVDSRRAPAPIDTSRGVGYWLSLIAILAGLVLAFLRLREDGSTLPWERRKA